MEGCVFYCFFRNDIYDKSDKEPLKPTTMKHLYFINYAIIALISISCKKDSVNAVQSACLNCKTVDSLSASSWKTIYINDSNWVRQGQMVFKSDLTKLLQDAGTTVSEVYSMQIVNESILLQFFPCCQVKFMDGELSGSVYSTGDEETCTLTFSYSGQDMHYGELPNSGALPFQSVEIKVWLWK